MNGPPVKRQSSSWIWAAFLVSALAAIGLFFVPAFVIRPFRQQSPRALWIALALRQHAPPLTLITALLCVALAFVLWKNSSRGRKFILAVTLFVVGFSAVMARLNYFEWMFHPIAGSQFLPASESKLAASEMVMAVRLGGEARAYPISQMAYHHVFNDLAGGVPVAVTY